jgi:hypothetical protein
MDPKEDIFFELSCAFSTEDFLHKGYVNDGEERIQQYIEGFDSYFSLLHDHVGSFENVYVIDKTVEDESRIDKRILEKIPLEANIIFACRETENRYGRDNKGAGLIESWEWNMPLMSHYEYIFYHEPRQKLLDFSFYEAFIKNPTNLFGKYIERQFNTGTFFMKTETLQEYISYRTAESMSENHITIEADMYDFFNGLGDRWESCDSSPTKKREYATVDKVNLLWHDQMAGESREF